MKTREEELEEMIDAVIKLNWNCRIFRALFAKTEEDRETRHQHPEFFLTLHDSLVCSFCVGADLLFEEKEKAMSLWSLIRKATPELANKLTGRSRASGGLIKRIGDIRNQACAHRWQAKTAQAVFAEVGLRVSMMTETTRLANFIICELAGGIDRKRREELEKQQLSEGTLQCVADDARRAVHGFTVAAF